MPNGKVVSISYVQKYTYRKFGNFLKSLQYIRNIYDPSTNNAVDLSSWSNLKKEICEKIYVFAYLFHFVQLL